MIYDYMIIDSAHGTWRTVATGLTRADVDRIRSSPPAGQYRRWFWLSNGQERYWHRPHRVNVWDRERGGWHCVDGFHYEPDAHAHARALSRRATTTVVSAPEGIWDD